MTYEIRPRARTGADLFNLEVGEFFVCDFDAARFDELERILMENPVD